MKSGAFSEVLHKHYCDPDNMKSCNISPSVLHKHLHVIYTDDISATIHYKLFRLQ